MSQWGDSKTKVKDIFDSIRNFALCGVVFYVGVLSLTKPVTAPFMLYLNYVAGSLMILLSIYLFFLNMRSFNNMVRREHLAGNVGSLFYYLVPPLILMLGINLFVQTAFSIQTELGKKVGELAAQDFY